ncbi:disintegrin and metalloproteinase domain-containing protein 32-like [Rhineura floridana]|uniref:disintegrin and metalloproteinase domain-containing protein 32-like n=1 Tax=Rhineura floridana TaxID=261503 RepID=UPI002AC855C5|nr:disintegrin and metalloproteinase domain-containing protein 32-like [Rhineura floridana]
MRLRLPWLLLGATLWTGLDCQTFLHITYPKKLPSNKTEDGLGDDESTQTYIITIKKKSYTVHLKQQTFLPNDFMVYTYNQGGFVHPSSPRIQGECFYEGYIQGFPNSVAVLSTCLGLRGLLQFENVSYGIEHLESSTNFEHLVYEISNRNLQSPLWTEDSSSTQRRMWSEDFSYKLLSDTVPLSDVTKTHRYIELYIVLDKGLFNYLGGNGDTVTNSIAQLIGFVNSIYSGLNITVVLSSLEFWTDHNKVSTSGEPDVLLRRFLHWKNSYLVLRPHDLAFLFVYREKPNYVGAGYMGKLCLRNFDAGVALYQKSVTIEIFSVILAQLLGLNLGMEYDNGKECKCPGGSICIMNTEAVFSNGIKTFSSCSIEDFQNFIKFKGAHCLSNRPNLKLFYKKRTARDKAICGNGVVEPGEKCDCGSAEECKNSKCCTRSCTLHRGAVCSNELCCENCQYKARNTICRAAVDSSCDFPEYCNGSSASCPANVYAQNGFRCGSNTGYCYGGFCQSADLHCQELFGKKSKSAPQACYEEINGQRDRFGHCGIDLKKGFKTCSFRDIRCGKLICEYPTRAPYVQMRVPVLYTPVKDTLCVSLDFKQPKGTPDPMLMKEGTKCGVGKVCIKQVCEKYDILKYDCDPGKKCFGHGICNNKRNCHCNPGWAPPNCKAKGSPLGGSIDSGLRILESDIAGRAVEDNLRTWILLSIFLFLPMVVGSAILIGKWARINKYFIDDDESLDDSESYTRSEEYSMSDKTSMSNQEDTM